MALTVTLCAGLWTLVLGSAGYLLLALASVLAFRPRPEAGGVQQGDVTVLRPLCGDEVGLSDALESLLSQSVDDERFRFILGVASARDPALEIAQAVAARHSTRRIEFVVNPRTHGVNPKVSNLINMSAKGLDDLVVVTDSDVILPAGSLQKLVDAASRGRVGAVTSLFRGRPGDPSSLVQEMGALYLDGWFLPTALLHARLGPASVCYGQLTAIKKEVLPGGGFLALADSLADDTELGHLARRAGRTVVFAPLVVEALVNDRSWKALFEHELRWAKTIRALQPFGYAASIFMHPGPLPLLLILLDPKPGSWLAVLGLVWLRWLLVTITHARMGRASGLRHADPVTLWLRDLLYFAVWTYGFFGRGIRWRGRLLSVGPKATVLAAAGQPKNSGLLAEAGQIERWPESTIAVRAAWDASSPVVAGEAAGASRARASIAGESEHRSSTY